jgi:hypothetical protein
MREPRPSTPVGAPPRPPARRAAPQPVRRRAPVSGHQPKRKQQEQQYQRLALIGATAIVIVVAILLGVGWYQSYVRPYRQTVIVVGNRHATMQDYITQIKSLIPRFSNSDPQVVLAAVPEAARQQIEDQFIVLERAQQAGATATEQEVDAGIAADLGVAAPAGGAPSRTAYESALTAKLAKTGLTFSQYKEQTRGNVLSQSLETKLGADYPKIGPEAKYEEIVLNDQASAKKMLDRLNGGESWETLVAEVHNSPTAGTVAQFDFQPKLQIDDKLSAPLFDLNPGGHTDVVATNDGKYTIARLIEKDDQHPISDDQIHAITPKLFANWIDDQKKTLTVKEMLSDDQKLFAIQHSGYTPPAPGSQPAQSAPPPQTAPSLPAQPQLQPDIPTAAPGIATPAGGLTIPSGPPAGGSPGR